MAAKCVYLCCSNSGCFGLELFPFDRFTLPKSSLRGYGGSADSSVVDVDISGNSNQFDIDWGYNASSERLDFDLDINTGSSNVWDINIDADDVTWNVDVIGSSNNFATTQNDGAYQSLTLEWVGSNGDIDILQSSGTCPTGISSCYGVINADFDSENAVVDIKQKDTGD